MRLATYGVRGAKPTYKEVRGPDGERFAKWRAIWRHKMGERFGVCQIRLGVDGKIATIVYGGLGRDDRRRLRNARKRERAVSK